MTPVPSTLRSLLTSAATFRSAATGGLAFPQHIDDAVHRNERGPFHGQQLQQRPGLAAADLPVGQLGAASGDPELAGETQLYLRWAHGVRGCAPPHDTLLPPIWEWPGIQVLMTSSTC